MLGRWVASIAVAVVAFIMGRDLQNPAAVKIYLAAGLLGAAIAFFVTPLTMRRSMRRHARHLFTDGAQKGVLGAHVLEIHNDGLLEKTDVNETKTFWSGIERVTATAAHTFVYTGSMAGYSIPHDRVTEGDLQEFLHDVEQHRAFATRLPA
jgi:hypothetical protein